MTKIAEQWEAEMLTPAMRAQGHTAQVDPTQAFAQEAERRWHSTQDTFYRDVAKALREKGHPHD